MTSVVDIVNQALMAIGETGTVSSVFPSDGSNNANVAATLYQTRINALMRAAPWGFATKQVFLTQLRATKIAGVLQPQSEWPPQPWQFEYAYPSDRIRARYILPNFVYNEPGIPLTTATTYTLRAWNGVPIPYKQGLDNSLITPFNDIKVLLTNQAEAQLVYTKRVEDPDLWDPGFLNAAINYLAIWFVQALARDRAAFVDQIRLAMDIIQNARGEDGNEGSTSMDNTPDWIRIRGGGWPTAEQTNFGWDPIEWPGGIYL